MIDMAAGHQINQPSLSVSDEIQKQEHDSEPLISVLAYFGLNKTDHGV